jgi:hypothetical protein
MILMKSLIFFIIIFLQSCNFVLAQDQLSDIKISDGYVSQIDVVISGSIHLIFLVSTFLSFIFMIGGGLKWIISGGDKAKIEEARDQIIAAVVGLLVLASAWAIINFTLQLLGIESLQYLLNETPRFG